MSRATNPPSEAPLRTFCPQCGLAGSLSDRFCARCGEVLDGTEMSLAVNSVHWARASLPYAAGSFVLCSLLAAIVFFVIPPPVTEKPPADNPPQTSMSFSSLKSGIAVVKDLERATLRKPDRAWAPAPRYQPVEIYDYGYDYD